MEESGGNGVENAGLETRTPFGAAASAPGGMLIIDDYFGEFSGVTLEKSGGC